MNGAAGGEPGEPEAKRRLFFALWPSDGLRETIQERSTDWVRKSGGRPMRIENLHLTLAFLGDVTEETARCVAEAAANASGEPFELTLDRYGWFPRPRVFWMGCQPTPEPLAALVNSLNQALLPCGIEPESRPFKVHMTLARKAKPPKGEWRLEPIVWPVEEFVLVESQFEPGGVRYQPIGRWRLA